MSKHDYDMSRTITAKQYPFYGLVMAAMRQASTTNYMRLKAAFPEVAAEIEARYHAPGGVLASDAVEEMPSD